MFIGMKPVLIFDIDMYVQLHIHEMVNKKK